MNIRLLFLLPFILILGCQAPDKSYEKDLSGDWNVRVSLAEKTKREMDTELKNADKDIQEAKTEMRNEFDKAKQEIRKALDSTGINITNDDGEKIESTELSEGLEKMVEGLGQMVEGIADMGIGLGSAITRAITNHLELQVTLFPDGKISATSKNKDVNIDINDTDNRWKVEDGKFVLYGEGKPEIFEIVPTADGFDLKGKEVILHLTPDIKN